MSELEFEAFEQQMYECLAHYYDYTFLHDQPLIHTLVPNMSGDAGRVQWRATIRAGIEQLVPRLEYVSFATLVSGVYDVTPDHQPILGRVDDGVFVAAGFSGHGFMIAPAVARLVADAVTGEPPGEALRVLDLARFAEKRPVPEPQLV